MRTRLGRSLVAPISLALALGCGHAEAARRPSRATAPGAGAAAGDWRGIVTFHDAPLDVAVHLGGAARDSSSFTAAGLMLLDTPAADVRSGGGDVHFALDDGDGPLVFDGSVVGDTLVGTAALPAASAAREGAPTMGFRLVRAPAPARPPYARHELTVRRGDVKLAATLLVPDDAHGPVPGVLLLQGSSTNLRAQYRAQADLFARAGFAVLSFDKRGNGASTGDYRRATYDDLVADARAAFDALAARPEVDRAHTGIWGLSQGAFIAPKVALGRAAFVVAVSAPCTPLVLSAAYQDSLRVAWAGRPTDDARAAANANRAIGNLMVAHASRAEVASLLAKYADAPWRPLTSVPAAAPSDAELAGWYWRGRVVDPTVWWESLQFVPTLLVYGEADELVPADTNARLVRRALARGLNKQVTVHVYSDANHVIRMASSPLVSHVGPWRWPTPAPGSLDSTTAWMRRRAGLAAR